MFETSQTVPPRVAVASSGKIAVISKIGSFVELEVDLCTSFLLLLFLLLLLSGMKKAFPQFSREETNKLVAVQHAVSDTMRVKANIQHQECQVSY